MRLTRTCTVSHSIYLPCHDELRSGGSHDKLRSRECHDELRSGGSHDELRSGGPCRGDGQRAASGDTFYASIKRLVRGAGTPLGFKRASALAVRV